jgi:tripartite-type tricarboxylate transporter receptor subunit TctC
MKSVQSRRSLALSAACLLGALNLMALPAQAQAQAAYPTKPVRIVVGFSAGGSTDVLARLLAKDMTEDLGQSFVVENKPGAGSNIAAELVVRAPADGYTLLMIAVTNAINQTLYPNLKFDVLKDFSPVGLAAKVPNMLVIYPKLPINSVQELIEYAKKNPSAVNFASSGAGTSIHMTGELFKMKTQLDIQHIAYKGSTPALTDLIGGQVQIMFDNMPTAWPMVQAGKLRALAITSPKRSPAAPDVPTMEESGFPGFDVSSWFGLAAPAGTPKEIVAKLNASMNKVLAKPEVQKRLDDLGATNGAGSVEQFDQFLKSQTETWGVVVKSAGAKAE